MCSGCDDKALQARLLSRNLFSHSSGNWEVQNQGSSVDQFLVRALFLTCRWLPLHCVSSMQSGSKLSGASSYKDTILFDQALPYNLT